MINWKFHRYWESVSNLWNQFFLHQMIFTCHFILVLPVLKLINDSMHTACTIVHVFLCELNFISELTLLWLSTPVHPVLKPCNPHITIKMICCDLFMHWLCYNLLHTKQIVKKNELLFSSIFWIEFLRKSHSCYKIHVSYSCKYDFSMSLSNTCIMIMRHFLKIMKSISVEGFKITLYII